MPDDSIPIGDENPPEMLRSRESSVTTRACCEVCCERGAVRALREAHGIIDSLLDALQDHDKLDLSSFSLVLAPAGASVVTPTGPAVLTSTRFAWIRFTPGAVVLYVVPTAAILLLSGFSELQAQHFTSIIREGNNGTLTLAQEILDRKKTGKKTKLSNECEDCCKEKSLPQRDGKRTRLVSRDGSVVVHTRQVGAGIGPPDGPPDLPPGLPPGLPPVLTG